MELDYYDQKLNVGVATRVVKQLKSKTMRKFQKILKLSRDIVPIKNKNFAIAQEDWTKSALKRFMKKLLYLISGIGFNVFCWGLYDPAGLKQNLGFYYK